MALWYNRYMTSSEETPVEAYLNTIENPKRREDSFKLLGLMQKATGVEPKLWGTIIGFGTNHYKYATGREGDTVAVGFAPRKTSLVIYCVVFYTLNADEVKKLGKYKLGVGCLYINKLEDVDLELLAEMTTKAFKLRNNS